MPRPPRVLNRRRIRGELPPGAAYVGRPSKWGNLFVEGVDGGRAEVLRWHRAWLLCNGPLMEDARRELRGLDLACWCAPLPCHADLLLRVANEVDET